MTAEERAGLRLIMGGVKWPYMTAEQFEFLLADSEALETLKNNFDVLDAVHNETCNELAEAKKGIASLRTALVAEKEHHEYSAQAWREGRMVRVEREEYHRIRAALLNKALEGK
jgi:hypothetical protein